MAITETDFFYKLLWLAILPLPPYYILGSTVYWLYVFVQEVIIVAFTLSVHNKT